MLARAFGSLFLIFAIAACSGGGSGSPPAPIAAVSPSTSAAPSASPAGSAAPSPVPASPSATPPSVTPTPSPTPKPTTTPGPNACAQTPAPAASPNAIAVVPFTTFTSKLSAASTICFSAYVFTNESFQALDTAAKNGANETVVLPQEEYSEDSSDANQLAADGAHIIYDQGTSTPPLHAKLALVDGSAFLDGRNWDTSDVVISDTYASDYTAIGNALALNPTSSANLDTLKSIALAREAEMTTSAVSGSNGMLSGITIRFMTESFSSGASNVIGALESAAQDGASVEVVVLSSYVQGNTSEMNLITTLENPPYNMSVRLNPNSGSEKMTLISNQTTGWFGSSNATSSSSQDDNYIDWGLTVGDPTVLSDLQSYYDMVYAQSSKPSY